MNWRDFAFVVPNVIGLLWLLRRTRCFDDGYRLGLEHGRWQAIDALTPLEGRQEAREKLGAFLRKHGEA